MPAVNPTPTQRAYLDFIRKYVELHKRAPAEHEMQAFFGTPPPRISVASALGGWSNSPQR